MTQQTPLGLTYPEASDHTRLWEHMQQLADDTDAAVQRALNGGLYGIQAGFESTGPSGAASFTKAVTFPTAFQPGAVYVVGINLNSGSGSTSGWSARAISISETGFTLFGSGPSTTFTASWHWLAIGPVG